MEKTKKTFLGIYQNEKKPEKIDTRNGDITCKGCPIREVKDTTKRKGGCSGSGVPGKEYNKGREIEEAGEKQRRRKKKEGRNQTKPKKKGSSNSCRVIII